MKDCNVKILKGGVQAISKTSFDLLHKVEKGDVDIYSAVYKINQEAHKLKMLLKNCSTT